MKIWQNASVARPLRASPSVPLAQIIGSSKRSLVKSGKILAANADEGFFCMASAARPQPLQNWQSYIWAKGFQLQSPSSTLCRHQAWRLNSLTNQKSGHPDCSGGRPHTQSFLHCGSENACQQSSGPFSPALIPRGRINPTYSY